MSTRGWYEYYVLDPSTGLQTLAMQFYKWGDATPENALGEYEQLRKMVESSEGCLPVIWLDDLLREQLGGLYENLPDHFSIAAFLFLIQRAYEETSPWRVLDPNYLDLPKEDRPDYRLGFEVGKAMVLNSFEPKHHPDPILDEVRFFIAVGHFVRPWKDYGLVWSVLQWLQYLTQITLQTEMGSISGMIDPGRWVSYTYRFFIWIDPNNPLRIERLAIELCDGYGKDLFTSLESTETDDEEHRAYALAESAKIRQQVEQLGVNLYSLRDSAVDFRQNEDRFWDHYAYEQPPLKHGRPTKRNGW